MVVPSCGREVMRTAQHTQLTPKVRLLAEGRGGAETDRACLAGQALVSRTYRAGSPRRAAG